MQEWDIEKDYEYFKYGGNFNKNETEFFVKSLAYNSFRYIFRNWRKSKRILRKQKKYAKLKQIIKP